MRLRNVLGVLNEKSAGLLANPLGNPPVAGASEQRLDAVEGIADAAASGVFGLLGPFVNRRNGQAQVVGNLFGLLGFEDFAQQFMGLHGEKMWQRGALGKREASDSKNSWKL